jgi:hypothetical protein
MKRLIVVCGVLLLLAVPGFAAAQASHPENSGKADFNSSTSFVVGSQTVPAGEYKFQCKTIDGRHYMVVTSADDGAEVARVPCEPEMLSAKAGNSEIRSMSRQGGPTVISSVRFKGEMVAHRIIQAKETI